MPTDSLQVDSLIAKISSKGRQKRDHCYFRLYSSLSFRLDLSLSLSLEKRDRLMK